MAFVEREVMDALYVGQTFGVSEVIKLTKEHVTLLCQCGDVMTRSRGTALPQSCKECSKKEYATYQSNSKSEALSIREYTADEELMIVKFKRSQK